ncbi:MAG: tRNA 4-thiouridine(8) synthase ThiI [Deltaproteobacteria bacterium]|nr:tRNA 4-thiouridine(8) synthase ThiI [Deltaproteobacteria bacterium]
MNSAGRKGKALGLCSGGLDSTLAGVLLREQGVDVTWISFETPFFSAKKAEKASKSNGIPLIVKNITEPYLPMLKNPPRGYGKNMNPCMDCHSLMFNIAGAIMAEINADFLFSGEVLGQRPMSQVRSSLRYVEKHSGFDGRILRPLSALRLEETAMEKNGLVDRSRLLGFSGRSRKPQMALAAQYGITDYPAPAGGCLLTEKVFSARLKDVFSHKKIFSIEELELLKHGRHFRLSEDTKIVVGRNKADNERIFALYRPLKDILIRMDIVAGPYVLMPGGGSETLIRLAAEICAGYSRAPSGMESTVRVEMPDRQYLLAIIPRPAASISDFLI